MLLRYFLISFKLFSSFSDTKETLKMQNDKIITHACIFILFILFFDQI